MLVNVAWMFTTAAAIFSLLLVVTGVAKIARPRDVEKALRDLGLPVFDGTGFLIGLVEVAAGALSFIWLPALAVQATMYVVFALWVAVAIRRGLPIASCGCLGRDDTPPTGAHVVLNSIGVLASALALLGEPFSLSLDTAGVAQVVVIAAGLFLAYVVLSDGARLEGVRAQ